ncbi:MAG: DNA-processing protein DprA [Candidatus Caenarcaniphilales bacterium]|nr:DNA-processing protein DprA [Candidatus Caenarcaniphilales bacterium]
MTDEIDYWLTFDRLTGIGLGTRRISALYQHFGSLKVAWEASPLDLKAVPEMPVAVVDDFVKVRASQSLELGAAKLMQHQVKAFTQDDPLYPALLKRLAVPPLILYVKGIWDLSWFEKAIAIVGTRQASEYAFAQTSLISGQLAALGFTIISGVATGIDTAAHKGAFQAAGARAIAVVASGVDQIVPQGSRYLYQVLERYGTILSEYPPETFPEKGFFPARNRIIAALSQSVLVSEAGEGSGSLITAKFARDLGQPVFCLAGRADHIGNKGLHDWIRKGKGKLITSSNDILEELAHPVPEIHDFVRSTVSESIPANLATSKVKADFKPHKDRVAISKQTSFLLDDKNPNDPKPQVSLLPVLSQVEAQIYEILSQQDLIGLDQLIDRANLPVAKVNSALMTLTLKKLLRREGALIGRA